MNKTFFSVPLIVLAFLLVCSGTVIAHEGEDHDKKVYEEGSYGSSVGTGHKYGGHEYSGDHGDKPGEYSKEYYEKKYGKYDHEKKEMYEEGSGMNENAHRMKDEMEHKRYEEGSR
jgi:hypothetical protein